GADSVLDRSIPAQLLAGGGAAVGGDGVVLCGAAAVRVLVRPAWSAVADSGRRGVGGRRDRGCGGHAGVPGGGRARLPRRARSCSIPSGGGEVRRVRERAQARERDV